MFSNIGWGELLILLAAGLIILGPERLPGAVSWSMKSLRQVRDYATGASSQLRDELGPEFDELRKPLSELNELRGMTPRAMVTKHLLDGDNSLFDTFGSSPTVDRSSVDAPNIKPVSKPLPVESLPVDAPNPTSTSAAAEKGGPTERSRHDITDWDAT
ncbi:Sec-independent protein translocase protein TatB [Gordonia soli]|uniref:Sec-independent protein translocase protein TatB n=1 Tax=Gordonia soli NBRC 108243 TaxID=1223545 RepID=M0QQU0_9ACTN|nr:Sec-independent protein translocase protein TatB [Gordonia soli]GAC70764.1 Sec-independent protein translocase protein TatB [Gordonia soli NBRC 108243]